MKIVDEMSYEERLKHYEAEKRQLWNFNFTIKEYEAEIKKLANKWKI